LLSGVGLPMTYLMHRDAHEVDTADQQLEQMDLTWIEYLPKRYSTHIPVRTTTLTYMLHGHYGAM